jgi:hypothetical protein
MISLAIKRKNGSLGTISADNCGESERKNLSQMASNAVGVTYHRLHHFLTEALWDAQQVLGATPAGDESV